MTAKPKNKKWSEVDLRLAAVGFLVAGTMQGAADLSGIPLESLKTIKKRTPDRWEKALEATRQSFTRKSKDIDAVALVRQTIESLTLQCGVALPALLSAVVTSRPRTLRGKRSQLDSLLRVWAVASEKLIHLSQIDAQNGGGEAWQTFQRNFTAGLLEIIAGDLAAVERIKRGEAPDLTTMIEYSIIPPVFDNSGLCTEAASMRVGKA